MSDTTNVQSVYVELDFLLDTRISTLASIDPESAIIALETSYHFRQEDKFTNVSLEEFKAAYAKRDVETLKAARITEGVRLLSGICKSLIEQTVALPYHTGVKLYVNIHPYKLNEEEIADICKAIVVWTDGTVPVEMINCHPKEITPTHCKNTYALMIMYTNYAEWLELHVEEFKRVQIPTMTLMVPAIFDCGKPSDEELEDIMKEAAHPFKVIEKAFVQFINLELIDIKYFSLLKP